VFRSGTFRDSMGIQNTWEDLHIKQMMDNYAHLAKKNILSSVPVRDGHKTWLVGNVPGRGSVVGWHQNVETKVLKSPVDNQEYTYLLVDYEITEQYALDKIENGTWRNRSSEIGTYMSNDEAEFWPVYMGFAFVDFPAVEGLNFSVSQGSVPRLYVMCDGFRENRVGENQGQQGSNNGAATLPFPVGDFNVNGGGQSGQQTGTPFSFTINGQATSDPTVVQRYVNTLETWAKESREGARKAFVAAQVQANKIPAPQQNDFEVFALGLNDQQYDMWTKTFGGLGGIPALMPQATGTSYAGQAPADNSAANGGQYSQEVQDALAVVKMHERNQMPVEQLKKTGSYGKLVTAGLRQA
jgi:hypothetical protein